MGDINGVTAAQLAHIGGLWGFSQNIFGFVGELGNGVVATLPTYTSTTWPRSRL